MTSLSKFWDNIKKVFAWIKVHSSVILLSLSLIIVSTIIFFCQRKRLKELQIELSILKTQVKLAKLAAEKAVKVQQLAELKEQDADLQKQLAKIEEDLKQELPSDMSEEDIVSMFKELGLLTKG